MAQLKDIPNKSSPPLRETLPLERRKIVKKTISNGFVWGLSLGALFLIFSYDIILQRAPLPIEAKSFIVIIIVSLFLFLLLVFGLSYLYQRAYYNTYFYDASADFLIIRKGVFMPRETTLPFEKINDVYVDQDLLDRIFNLFDVHFSTATIQSGLNAHIDGLNKQNAYKLRDLILTFIKNSVKRY